MERNAADLEEKIEKYLQFWSNNGMDRPLLGFSLGGYFPFMSFKGSSGFRVGGHLAPEMINPEAFLDDYERIVDSWGRVEDDVIRAVAPLPGFPWLEAMVGCPVRVSTESVWAEPRNASWEELEGLNISSENPWLQKYLEFLEALVEHAEGRYPVGQPFFRGVSDLMAALRGSDRLILDMYDAPDKVLRLAEACTSIFKKVIEHHFEIVPEFDGGYVVEQFALWAPDRVVRLQEDASALYSPKFYRDLLRPYDAELAASYRYNVIHLHSSSLSYI